MITPEITKYLVYPCLSIMGVVKHGQPPSDEEIQSQKTTSNNIWKQFMIDAQAGSEDAMEHLRQMAKGFVEGWQHDPYDQDALTALEKMAVESIPTVKMVIDRYTTSLENPAEKEEAQTALDMLGEIFNDWEVLVGKLQDGDKTVAGKLREKMTRMLDQFDGYVLSLNAVAYKLMGED